MVSFTFIIYLLICYLLDLHYILIGDSEAAINIDISINSTNIGIIGGDNANNIADIISIIAIITANITIIASNNGNIGAIISINGGINIDVNGSFAAANNGLCFVLPFILLYYYINLIGFF